MPINFSCPISGTQRDNNTVRIVAAQVLLVAVASGIVALLVNPRAAAIVTGVLVIDFVIRAFVKPKYSPLATLARGVSSGLDLPKVMVDNAPKVFAARIGVVFTLATTVLFGFGWTLAGEIVLGVLAVFAFLESVFSFCAGCWMYSLLPQSIGNVLAREIWEEKPRINATPAVNLL